MPQCLVDIKRYAEKAQRQIRHGQIQYEQVVCGAHVFVQQDCPDDKQIAEYAQNNDDREYGDEYFLLVVLEFAVARACYKVDIDFKQALFAGTRCRKHAALQLDHFVVNNSSEMHVKRVVSCHVNLEDV